MKAGALAITKSWVLAPRPWQPLALDAKDFDSKAAGRRDAVVEDVAWVGGEPQHDLVCPGGGGQTLSKMGR
ncbi:hypothetical protein OCOJLMKI_1750 [Methylobacterium iners]|uniref:Transposase n=1 Tax=Methylobacterium iners TaxID=418707 RepID=A0ABQ4RX55_9HYPH|nr:hypothetical protein OCOJLMKI_1750 [Methylobacterium iners]